MDRTALINCFQDSLMMSNSRKLKKLTDLAISSNRVYPEGYIAPLSNRNEEAAIHIETSTTFAVAKKYINLGKVAVLNFANPENPGGGVQNGAMAQEECLCRSSNLFPCLNAENVFEEYYHYHRRKKSRTFSDRLIYTAGITVFKDDKEVPELMDESGWFSVDVITCAAPYLEKGRYVNQEYLFRLLKKRIKNIFEAARDNHVDVIILGAFGCGAFHNPPALVAQAFRHVIFAENYQKDFRKIVFSIKPTGTNCPNVSEFIGQFSDMSDDYDGGICPLHSEPEWRFYKVPRLGAFNSSTNYAEFHKWQKNNPYFGKQFSILGDSISTLDGYNSKGYSVFYDEVNRMKSGVLNAEDTWWGKTISFFGGELLVNDAWSGSRVTMLPNKTPDSLFPSACSKERTSNLHQGDVKPDVIIINIGVNDWANGVIVDDPFDDRPLREGPTEDLRYFGSAYSHMLFSLHKNYPDAEIWCCTLCETIMPGKPAFKFPHAYAGVHIEEYNSVIQNVAEVFGCKLIDLYSFHTPYASLDGTHPTEEGMSTIASLIICAITGKRVEDVVKDFIDKEKQDRLNKYVDPKPDATTGLFTDTVELFRESNGQKLTAKGTALRVGRDHACDIVVEHPYASRHHATFFFEGGDWYIRDEKSTNKTYLNGTSIEPGKKYRLYVGDMLAFGPEKYCFFKSRMIPPTPKPSGNFDEAALAILESSIKVFVDSGFHNDTAFKLIITALSDAPLYVPVQIDVAAMLGNLDPTKLKPGDTIKPEKDVRVKVLTLNLEGGGEIVPLFTSTEEVNKGQNVSTMRYYPSSYLPILLKMEKHVVINPFSDHKLVLTFDMIKSILKPVVDNKTQNLTPVPPVPKPVVPPVNLEKKEDPTTLSQKKEPEKLIGKLIDGRYRILTEIGRGGVSRIYLGIHERANKQWAIKVIDQTAPLVRNNKKILLQEPYMMMQFNHPAIPKVVDVIEDEQYIYIIREYIEGKTLSNILKERGTIPVDTAVAWTIQLCEALHLLHTHNPPYVFRDMKPGNIMLQPDGNLKLIDFGLAMVYDPSKQDDTVMGTRGYAAPEQYAGESDFRSDIFGLGMTLHYMLTGVDPCQPPYEAQPIRMINPELPHRLEEIVNRCIQRNPDGRFQSCEELIIALQSEPYYLPKRKGLLRKLFGKK